METLVYQDADNIAYKRKETIDSKSFIDEIIEHTDDTIATVYIDFGDTIQLMPRPYIIFIMNKSILYNNKF